MNWEVKLLNDMSLKPGPKKDFLFYYQLEQSHMAHQRI